MATNRANRPASGIAAPGTGPAVPQSTQQKYIKLPCALDVFFPLCRLAWGYCRENLGLFSEDSRRFTAAYVEQQLALVGTVEKLPTIQARRAAATLCRNQLLVDAQAVKMLAQKLKNYIGFAYREKELVELALQEAGLSGYSRTGRKWAKVSAMAKSASTFAQAKLAKLTENDNMPDTFPAALSAAATAFEASWSAFVAKEKAVTDGTGTQDEGIRQLLQHLSPMLETGKRIFIFNAVARKKFTFSQLKNEVEGQRPGGVKGRVVAAATGRAMAGVRVSATVEGEVREAMTDAKGKYQLKLPAGTYEVSFALEGAEPVTVVKTVRPGVKGRLLVQLRPLVVDRPVLPAIVAQLALGGLVEEAVGGVGG